MSISLRWARVAPSLRALFVGLSIVAMFAAGCGGSSGESASVETAASDSDATPSGDQSDASGSDEKADASDSGSGDSGSGDESYLDAESPLSSYLGFDMSADDMQEEQRQIEQKVQECMLGQGFDYEMNDVSDMTVFGDPGDMDPSEYAAEHGYGMADSYLDMPGLNDEGEYVDPNEAITKAMSDTERAAWETALYGPPLSEAEMAEGGDVVMEPTGCYGEATSEIYGDFAVFDELGPAFEAMSAAMNADPRVVEINTKWAECMSDAGYTFQTPEESWMYISDKVDALTAQGFAVDTVPAEGGEEVPPGGEDGASAESEAMPDMPSLEELRPQLEEIRTEEIAIATADAACQGDNSEKLQEISREYELKFIEDNKATLDRLNS